jgi:deazaflavin-dependent oxidoreductase (nitroreductase family)
MLSIGNFFISLLLRSPLHKLLSNAFLVITLRGRKSGRTISTPVNYWADGNTLIIASKHDRMWWKNLRGGADVRVRLRGKNCAARALAVESPAEVADGLRRMFASRPGFAKMYGVRLAENGLVREEDLLRIANPSVLIRITVANEYFSNTKIKTQL